MRPARLETVPSCWLSAEEAESHLCPDCGFALEIHGCDRYVVTTCGVNDCGCHLTLTPPVLPSGDLKAWAAFKARPVELDL